MKIPINSLRAPPIRLLPMAYTGLFYDLIRRCMKDSPPPREFFEKFEQSPLQAFENRLLQENIWTSCRNMHENDSGCRSRLGLLVCRN